MIDPYYYCEFLLPSHIPLWCSNSWSLILRSQCKNPGPGAPEVVITHTQMCTNIKSTLVGSVVIYRNCVDDTVLRLYILLFGVRRLQGKKIKTGGKLGH